MKIRWLAFIFVLLSASCGGSDNDGTGNGGESGDIDVVLTNMSSPSAANAGDTITVEATVANQGGSLTGGIAVYVYLSLDNVLTTYDTYLIFDVILLLDAGESTLSSQNVTLPSNLPSGTYYIGTWADKDDAIPESNESNNKQIATISITGTSCVDDMYEEDDTGATANTYVAGAMQSHIHCSDDSDWVAINAVGGTTYGIITSELGADADTRLELYDTNRATLLTSDNDSGYVGESSVLSWMAPSSGTYYVRATTQQGLKQIGPRTDYNLTIAEPASDLTISSVGINGTTNLTSGDLVPVTYTVANQGMDNAAATELGVYLSTDSAVTTGDLLIGSVDIAALDAGTSDSDSLDFWAPLPGNVADGTYYLAIIADHDDAVAEMTESNNISDAITVTVNAAQCTSDAYEEDDTWEQARAAVINEVRSHNFCDDWADYVYLDLLEAGTIIIQANGTGGPIDPYVAVYDSTGSYLGGESDDISQNADYVFTAPSSGRYYIAAKTTAGNYGGDTYERTYNFSISTEAPDLSVYNMNVRQLSLFPGSTAFVSTTIQNTGYADATNFYVKYYASTDSVLDGGDTLLGTKLFATASVGNWTTEDAQVLIPQTMTPATYNLLIDIDPDNLVAEVDENNNGNPFDYMFTIDTEICATDSYEQNDTAAGAKTIALNDTQTHNSCDDRLDWIKFTTTANQQYLFSTSNASYMRIIDSDATTELANATQYLHWEALTSNTYYLLLAPEYYLDLSGTNSSRTITLQTCDKDSYEDDDGSTTSGIPNPALITTGQTQTRNHCDDKIDWLVFDAVNGTNYTISTGNLGSNSDTVLTLYDTTPFFTEASNDDRNGSALESEITWTAPADGRYYILVENKNIGANTQYTITLTTP